jgi:hypothetical protein
MDPIIVTLLSTNVQITFTAPDDQGSAIIAYEIDILNKNTGSFESVNAQCSGGSSSVFANRACLLPMTYFLNTLGYSVKDYIYGKVQAQNAQGWSPLSLQNSDQLTVQS